MIYFVPGALSVQSLYLQNARNGMRCFVSNTHIWKMSTIDTLDIILCFKEKKKCLEQFNISKMWVCTQYILVFYEHTESHVPFRSS